MTEFKVPELGENVATGDVTKVLVNVGDTITREQPVLELETDKATIEVPSSVAGVVKEIRVKQGQKVKVGEVVLTVDEAASAAAASASGAAAATSDKPADETADKPAPSAGAPAAPAAAPAEKPASKVVDINRAPSRPAAASAPQAAPASSAAAQVAAAPSTRRYARELGVDI